MTPATLYSINEVDDETARPHLRFELARSATQPRKLALLLRPPDLPLLAACGSTSVHDMAILKRRQTHEGKAASLVPLNVRLGMSPVNLIIVLQFGRSEHAVETKALEVSGSVRYCTDYHSFEVEPACPARLLIRQVRSRHSLELCEHIVHAVVLETLLHGPSAGLGESLLVLIQHHWVASATLVFQQFVDGLVEIAMQLQVGGNGQ